MIIGRCVRPKKQMIGEMHGVPSGNNKQSSKSDEAVRATGLDGGNLRVRKVKI